MKTHPRFQAGKRGSENLRGSKRHDTHSHMCMLEVCERACVSACTSTCGGLSIHWEPYGGLQELSELGHLGVHGAWRGCRRQCGWGVVFGDSKFRG